MTAGLTGLLLVLLLLSLWHAPSSWRGIAGYEPLHTLLETLSIGVAALIISVGWSARLSRTSSTLLLVSSAFVGIALLDFSHMMSFQGMPAYVTPSNTEKAINFWLVARLLAAAVLLYAALSRWERRARPWQMAASLCGVLLLVAVAHGLFLFYPEQMPRTFVAGLGLTALKVGLEYFIIALNLLTAGALLWRMRGPLSFNAPALLGAVLTMAMSEFFFTLYDDVTDVFNLAGHIYKVFAYFFIYRTVYADAVERPYREVDAAQSNLKATLAAVPDLVFEMTLSGHYHAYHSPPSDLLAAPEDVFIGRHVSEVMPKATADTVLAVLQEAADRGESHGKTLALDLPAGVRWFELTASRKDLGAGEAPRVIILSRDITQRVQDEVRLRMLGQAVSNLNDMVIITDAGTGADGGPRIVFVNAAFERGTGYAASEVLGQSPRLLQGARTQAQELERIRQALQQWQPVRSEIINYRKTGEEIWVEIHITPMADGQGGYTHWVAVLRDITSKVRDRKALQDALQYNQTILDSMADALVTSGADGLIRSVNKAATEMFGYTPEEIIGRNVSVLMPEPHRSKHGGYMVRYMTTDVPRIIGKTREMDAQRKDGSVFPVSLSICLTSHRGETTFVALIRDITQRRMDEEEIRRLAFYDGLTGLPNRRLLTDHLRHALAASRRSLYFGAVMFLDLDHFKLVNDTLGHAMGDELLRQVGARLQSAMREGDTVARIGGDEFVLVLENLSRDRADAMARAEGVANKVLNVMAAPFFLNSKQQTSGTSIGVVLFERDEKSVDELLKEADAALYQAKGSGRSRFCFFDPEMLASNIARSQLEDDIRRALKAGEFRLYYQVQMDARTHQPLGAEALIRWLHPQRGMVPPNQFIPVAEESGLILAMGQWVLETACAQLCVWATHPLARHLTLAINVSATQFAQEDFVQRIQQALQHSGAPAERLKIELTESAVAANLDDVIGRMNAIRQLGVRFSLDDFGTGYSSLTYLKRLPLDQLKIDQSFVRDLLSDESDASIARTIATLGRSLNLAVIAEGVETEGQRAFLEGVGCHAYQGYLYGKPMPAEEFLASLAVFQRQQPGSDTA